MAVLEGSIEHLSLNLIIFYKECSWQTRCLLNHSSVLSYKKQYINTLRLFLLPYIVALYLYKFPPQSDRPVEMQGDLNDKTLVKGQSHLFNPNLIHYVASTLQKEVKMHSA